MSQSSSGSESGPHWQARPPHSDWRRIAPEFVDEYRAKDWEVRFTGAAQPSVVHEALELAEDVLSRRPFSTDIWPNGMHPQTGIEKIRAALSSLSSGDRKSEL